MRVAIFKFGPPLRTGMYVTCRLHLN